jgi:hypothetical protein
MSIKLRDLFNDLGYPYEMLEIDVPIDVSEKKYEIRSWNPEKNQFEWSRLSKIVKKEKSQAHKVICRDSELLTSSNHMVWSTIEDGDEGWSFVSDLIGVNCKILTNDGAFEKAEVIKLEEYIDILDIEVEGNNSYISNGLVSHNTMYGDNMVTPGG